MFTGTLRLKICEACGLRPTDFQTRHTMTFGRLGDQQLIDPYVSIDVDQNFIDRSTTKQRTFDPVWNESFIHEVENANVLGMTIFHEGPITDVFVANMTIPFDDLVTRNENDQQDFWCMGPLISYSRRRSWTSGSGAFPDAWVVGSRTRSVPVLDLGLLVACRLLLVLQDFPRSGVEHRSIRRSHVPVRNLVTRRLSYSLPYP
ncbi:protein kinase C [Culex quinquefasciatus]|uniref:Protein kinase C n=1 Tax=Culex quinquefasciatus TaxID=7176 RepID=B0X1J0_CULQU|nr:protein kinase C [Culex quinquefasciatus]|eukprot:XP_001863512.1 protein kinase C [Culex quinquefasciatus]